MRLERLQLDLEGPVARVWLNRPDTRNAFDGLMVTELRKTLFDLGTIDAVRVIVLGGRGPAFCAGADLQWMKAAVHFTRDENLREAQALADLFFTVYNSPKPVVARVHGAALGGGAGLVAACDIPVAALGTQFGFTEVRLGIIPAVISPYVVGKIGESAARELFLTGERFEAVRAAEIGLVRAAVPRRGPRHGGGGPGEGAAPGGPARHRRGQGAHPRGGLAARGGRAALHRGAHRGPARLSRGPGGNARLPREAQALLGPLKRALGAVLGLLAGGLVVLCVVPSPIDPLAYDPPPPPALVGPLAPNEALRAAEHLAAGRVQGPEDLAFDASGRLYAATAAGTIVRLDPAGEPHDFATTGGRPLGLRFAPSGDLIVCDAARGLLSVDPAGRVSVLTSEAAGTPFRFTNNLDLARDGTVYFTDASSGFGQRDYLFDLFEARPRGRFLRYDPVARRTTVLLRDLYFANGVALSAREDFVLVNETYRYRTRRYWLEGDKAGTSDVFLDNLPGFPDNLDGNRKGSFWMAFFTVRNPIADAIHPHPFVKSLLAKLPRFTWPRPRPYGLVLEVDEEGRILRSLHDPDGRQVSQVTTAREHEGSLYLGTLEQAWIGKLALPPR